MIVVLRILQNILDEIISLFDFEDYVIEAVNHLVQLDSAKIFILLTDHKLHDVLQAIDLLQDLSCVLIYNVDNAFPYDNDDVSDSRILLNYCKRQELSSNISDISICIGALGVGTISSWDFNSIWATLLLSNSWFSFCNEIIN